MLFLYTHTLTTEIYTLSLHDALPILSPVGLIGDDVAQAPAAPGPRVREIPRALAWVQPPRALVERSEEHTSELQSPDHLVCRLLLEKKKKIGISPTTNADLTLLATAG